MSNIDPIQHLIRTLARLPGIGEKSAARLTFHLLEKKNQLTRDLAQALLDLDETVALCTHCYNPTRADKNPCHICADERRDKSVICVVERPQELQAIERLNEFRGVYHVLHGSLSPLDGRGPEDIKARELIQRLGLGGVREVILATNPSIEGDATALYLGKLIKPLEIAVSRLAQGLPIGGNLEYADKLTLSRALEARRKMD
jgi:recombination protein RecR